MLLTRQVLPVAVVAASLWIVPAAAGAACPTAPRPLCREFGRTQLRFDAAGNLSWKATGGPATSIGDFGVPTTSTNLSLCAWDDDGPVLAVDVPAAAACADGPCWEQKGTTGWRYDDRDGTAGAMRRLDLKGSAKTKTRVRATAASALAGALPVAGTLVVQLLRDDGPFCFESTVHGGAASGNDATEFSAKVEHDAAAPVAALPSAGCGGSPTPWIPGTPAVESLEHDARTRSFRVWLPPSYDDATPTPVVFLMHGGFGSGSQVETASRMLSAATAAGFVVVSPDGLAGSLVPQARTWNAGGCCGFAVSNDIDDVGFVGAMLDRLEQEACIDTRRVHATGMSNGSMVSHRLACDLGDRIRSVATVAGTDMTVSCKPARPVPVLSIHGTADANVPFGGGVGCGTAAVVFRSVEETLARWRGRDGCAETVTATRTDGDATCTTQGACAPGGLVESCVVENGGHQWPGGEPPSVPGLSDCPFGYQSQLYPASERALAFFEASAPR